METYLVSPPVAAIHWATSPLSLTANASLTHNAAPTKSPLHHRHSTSYANNTLPSCRRHHHGQKARRPVSKAKSVIEI